MLVQTKFKRLKVNAGFTRTLNGDLLIKISEKQYSQNYLGKQIKFDANKSDLVWVDSYQVKKWYQW